MVSTLEKNMKVLKTAVNDEYMTVLVRKENGNYAVLIKQNGRREYDSFYRSFKEREKSRKTFWYVKRLIKFDNLVSL